MKLPHDIVREYEQKRRRAELAGEMRRDALYKKHPRLYATDMECKKLAFALGAAKLNGDAAETEKLVLVLAALDESRSNELKKLGIDADYLKPVYECRNCSDTGYLDAAKTRQCACLREKIAKHRYVLASIDVNQSFENFDPNIFKDDSTRRQMLKARDICLDYANAFPTGERLNLLLIGPVGIGKTYLLDCVAQKVIAHGHSVLKLTAYNFINSIMSGLKDGKVPTFIEPELLIIDDLGTEPLIPNVTIEHLQAVINERIIKGRGTGFATNLSVGDLRKAYGERITSRLLAPKNGLAIQLKGGDLRLS